MGGVDGMGGMGGMGVVGGCQPWPPAVGFAAGIAAPQALQKALPSSLGCPQLLQNIAPLP